MTKPKGKPFWFDVHFVVSGADFDEIVVTLKAKNTAKAVIKATRVFTRAISPTILSIRVTASTSES